MRQPIPLGPGGTSDSSGNLTLSYPNIPTGQTWIGTMAIPGAPASALIVATVGNITYGSWTGSNTFGPITVGQSDSLELTLTNLVPSTPYQAAWNGVVYTNEDGPLTWPSSNTSTSAMFFPQVPLGSITTKLGTNTFTVQVQSSWRSLYIAGPVVDAGLLPIIPIVTGVQSTQSYPVITNGLGGADYFYYQVPLVPGLDQTLTVTYYAALSGSTVYYGADFAPIDQAVYFATTPTVKVTGGSTTAVETYSIGGVSTASVTTTSTTTTQLLAAPAAGTKYRLHLASIFTASGSLDVQFFDSASTFCQLHAGSGNQQTLDGLIVGTAINVKNSAVASTQISVRYDTIATPTIT